MAVRDHLVFSGGMGYANCLGRSLEEIDDWRTTQLNGLHIHHLRDGRQAVAQLGIAEEDQNFEGCTQPLQGLNVQAGQIEEEELLRKVEVLLQ